MRLSSEACRIARALIGRRLGLDFPENRQADLQRGVREASRAASFCAPEGYLTWLATLPDESPEWRRLAGYLTVGETCFFRDAGLFEALSQDVLQPLIEARRAQGLLRLRLWSAGCATGEEPYSLAILLDRLVPERSLWALTILATDVNVARLDRARRGLYRPWSFRGTPGCVRDRYFRRRGADGFELDPDIRRMVTLAPLNLAGAAYPSVVTNTSAMDLILCRNVLMYFTADAQRAVVARLAAALAAGGWLAVAAVEAGSELFSSLVPAPAGTMLYRRAPTSAAPAGASAPVGIGLASESSRSSSRQSTGLLAASAAATPRPVAASRERGADAPPDPPGDLQRARALADQGDLDGARELCEAALSHDRLDPQAHLLLAAVCQERGEIPMAIEAVGRAIYLAPDSGLAHFLLGSLLLRQGAQKRARRSMEVVVRLLGQRARDEILAGGDGLTAGRLADTARAYLQAGT